MKRLCVVVCAIVTIWSSPAFAERFVSAYAPRAGERAEHTVVACRSDDQGQGVDQNCGTFIYLEEVLGAGSDGMRVRVTLQSITAPNGEGLGPMALASTGMTTPVIYVTNEAGEPQRVENRDEIMAANFALLDRSEGGDPAALQQVRTMFERMDDPSFAQLQGRYFAPLSMFQGIEMEVGAPLAGRMEIPFPLDPSIPVIADAQFAVTAIEGGVARAVYSERLDEASVLRATQALIDQIPQAQGLSTEGTRIARSVDVSASVDVASGRTIELTQTVRSEFAARDRSQIRIERVRIERRMLNPN